jgi:hypothetical protein
VTTGCVMDANTVLTVVLYDGDAWYLYGPDLVARITIGNRSCYHAGRLGSIGALISAVGEATRSEPVEPRAATLLGPALSCRAL